MSETYDDYENWDEEGDNSPVALVGILVMALTSAAIIANALFMQPKSVELDLISKADKQHSTQLTGTLPVAKPQPGRTALQADQTAMILAVQRQLTMFGYYVGPLDGMEGTQTREAILAYQDAMGMPATGRVSLHLVDVLTGRKSFSPVGVNQSVTTTQAIGQTSNIPSIAALPRPKPTAYPKGTVATKRLKVPFPQQTGSEAPVPPNAIPKDPVLAKVQSALKRFGYGDLTVDGLMGSATRAAISAFQRSRGHPVTGTVNDRLLQEMIIMGYLDMG